MHRMTPLATSFLGYVSGGARSVVHGVDDLKGMQEMAGNFMAKEFRSAIESPQNFGFTSVVMDAIKDKLGAIVGSAETFISFIGGNRSFSVAGNMDDRRHRLTGLDKGDSAMYRTKGAKQQIQMAIEGLFASAPQDKKLRFAMIDEDSEQDMDSQSFQQQEAAAMQPGGGGAPAIAALRLRARGISPLLGPDGLPVQLDASSGGAAGAGGGAGGTSGQQKGQQSLKDKNQKAKRYFEITKDKTTTAGTEVHLKQDDGNTYVHVKGSKVYLGSEAGKGKFAIVATLKGPAKTRNNVMGNIG